MIQHCSRRAVVDPDLTPPPNRKRRPMFRLLKYAPIVIPMVVKFAKSPRGQRTIASVRTRVQGLGSGPKNPRP